MLELLETFAAVAEAGSLNRAAESLHRTQPAITRQIRALEGRLGAVLLSRSPRGVALTPAGAAVLPHARQALAEVAACLQAAEAAGAAQQRLRLAAGMMVTQYVLPPVLSRFRALHPDVLVELHPGMHGDAVQRLLDYTVDAAVIGSEVRVPQLRRIPVFSDPLVLVEALRQPRLPPTAPASLAELEGQTLLLSPPQSGLRQQLEDELAQRRVSYRLAEYPTAETIKTAVALGMGATILPRSAVAHEASAGTLLVRPIADWPEAARTVQVMVRAEGKLPPPVQALIRLLKERYDQTSAAAGTDLPRPVGS